jgi:hypothetical protein
MKPIKLDPLNIYEVKAHPSDQLELWPSPFDDYRQNLTLAAEGGKPILSIYNITKKQLEKLHAEIGEVLTTE